MPEKIPFSELVGVPYITRIGRAVLEKNGHGYFVKARRGEDFPWLTVESAPSASIGAIKLNAFLDNRPDFIEAFLEDKDGSRIPGMYRRQKRGDS